MTNPRLRSPRRTGTGNRDVSLEADRPDAVPRGDMRSGRSGAVGVEVADRDRRAVLGEALGGRLADAAGAAGDQRNAPFRPFGHVCSLPRV